MNDSDFDSKHMRTALEFFGRLDDIHEAISESMIYLEKGEMFKAWITLISRQQMDKYEQILTDLENSIPDWQEHGCKTEEEYLRRIQK